MVSVSQFLRIVEIRTKVISVSGFAVGATYTVYRYGPVDPVVFAITLAAVLAVDMATTGFNTFFDFYSGVDRRGVNRETDKVLVHQNVAAGPALLISLGLYAIAAGLGIVLAVIATPLVVPIGAISMLIGFLYNAGPLPLSRTPLGELFAGGFLGWVLVTLTILILAPDGPRGADFLVGLPSMVLVGSILTVNNTCDIDGDRSAGRRTLSIVLGRRAGEMIVYLLGASAFAGISILGAAGIVPRAAVVTGAVGALAAIPFYVRLRRRGFSHATKGVSMGTISRVFQVFTVAMILPFFL
jgi:1,4-dihydroxy-2-naphthoate octaprenyltransferase